MELTKNNKVAIINNTNIVKLKNHDITNSIIRYCYNEMAILNPKSLYNSTYSLRKISKSNKIENAHLYCKSIISKMLLRLNKAAFGNNTERYMSEDQISDLSVIIFDDYGDMNINELAYIEKGIKKGIYGTLYGNYSTAFVCQAFEVYRKERSKYMDAVESKVFQEKLKLVQGIDGKGGLLSYKKKKLVKLQDAFLELTNKEEKDKLELEISKLINSIKTLEQ